MVAKLSPYYPLIGELCIKCGAVEFELDCFLFGTIDVHREKFGSKFNKWPQQATHKLEAFSFIIQKIMQFPPFPRDFNFNDTDDVRASLNKLYEVRNIIFHGTPVTGGAQKEGLDFAKVRRSSDKIGNYTFEPAHIALTTLHDLIKMSDNLLLYLDACLQGLRNDRGGWLTVDVSVGRRIVIDSVADQAKRQGASVSIHRQEAGQK